MNEAQNCSQSKCWIRLKEQRGSTSEHCFQSHADGCVKFSVKSGGFKTGHAAGIATCRLAEPNHP